MNYFGLTGGIGCGKSTVAAMFKEHGNVSVISTDDLAKEIMEDERVLREILRTPFQSFEFLAEDGKLNIAEFSETFFANPLLKMHVENVVHPLVWSRVREIIAEDNETTIWLVESAIIFETHVERTFKDVIGVTCDVETQFARLSKRGYSLEDIFVRTTSQLPTSLLEMLTRYSVDTSDSLEKTKDQVSHIYRQIEARCQHG